MDEFDPLHPPRSRLSWAARLLLLVPSLTLAFLLGLSWREGRERAAVEAAAAPRAVADAQLLESERHTVELFSAASPSVAYITTISRRRNFFDRRVYEVPSGTGSGFLWDREGHVVTNYHVVAGVIANVNRGERVRARLADQSEWDAEVLGWAPEKDLAVLRIEAPRDLLRPVPIGSSRDLQVGQSVYAIGNPFGLDQTLTTGVVSALGREIESLARVPIRDVIQTDAAINPGNSGGPLLDSSGRLIGVNTQIFTTSGSSAGIGFAIPVDTVNWVVPDLIRYGRIRRPVLGISSDDQYLRRVGLEGVLVIAVTRGSGAESAGLRPTLVDRRGTITQLGDIIVALEGEKIKDFADLQLALERFEPGRRVRLTVLRDNEEVELEIELSDSTSPR
ncbi:MAG TPA: trypsin-like peptidase domain-containing protein [Thermoanaerobaculia bacterium]|nr:trypsin-like peptidase domain-containing protein [Thermoanaerobaculia bacterium]